MSAHTAGDVAVERSRSQSLPHSHVEGPQPPGRPADARTVLLQQAGHTFHAGQPAEDRPSDGELYLPQTGLLRSSETAGASKSVPEEQRRFVAYQVESLIKEVLESKLYKVRYEPNTCSRLAQELCAAIKEKTKGLNLPRYKLVTHVMLGEDTDKSVQVAARCLWNQETDNFAAATFRNNWIYAVAIVYGMYLE